MKKSSILSLITICTLVFSSCFNDLDTVPLDKDVFTADAVYKDATSYRKVLAKVYAGFAVSGQQGAAGQPDIEGIDEGFGQYLRGFWYHQELTTDEAVIGWNDQTIKDNYCYIEMNCEGMKSMAIRGELAFDRSLIIPDNNGNAGSGKAKGRFSMTLDKRNDPATSLYAITTMRQ